MILKKFLKKLYKNEQGSVIVIVAASMTFILILTAFVIDFGLAYFKTAEIQNAADAAVLAAGMSLPINQGDSSAELEAKNTAILYVHKNLGIDITSQDVILSDIISGKYTSVKVNIPREQALFFSKIVGINTVTVTRDAKANISPCIEISGAAPLGVEYMQLQQAIASGNTQHIHLKYGAGDGEQGSYGAIDLDGVKGGGANDFTAWLEHGYQGTLSVGEDLLPVEKGNMSGPTESAINQRYNACTHFPGLGGCTAEHYDPDCPRILKVLVIEKIGTSYVRIKGFAAFVIEGESTNAEVIGSYVKYFEEGNISGVTNWGTTDYGLYNLGLTD